MAEVKLFRSQRLTDNPDGGGLSTSIEVVDGEVNNLFDDISRIDRVNGDLSLRKVFQQAVTSDTALFAGMHAIVQAPPLDERVSVVLFRTQTPDGRYSWSDERSQAQAAVERYLDASVITRMIPYDRQLGGQRSVLVLQRPELGLPEIGQVYALEDPASGFIEYIAVQSLEHQVQTFTDNLGDFRARVITLTITQPLSREFAGSQPSRIFTTTGNGSVIRATLVSDAARYRGVVSLAEDASMGDTRIRVESVYAQLVPSTLAEVAITDAEPAGLEMAVAARSTDIALAWNNGFNSPIANPLLFPSGILPGTLKFSWGGLSGGDVGGDLVVNNVVVGHIDYRAGQVRSNGVVASTSPSMGVNYTPASHVATQSFTDQIPVDVSNRGYVYTRTLTPLPGPGSTSISYRALGKWYTLTDDGTGALVGEPGTGSGLVNFATGTTTVSLAALPDINSSLLYAWGTPVEYVQGGAGDPAVPEITMQLSAGSCKPGTLIITWPGGTAADDGAGALTGGAMGRVNYGTGEVALRYVALPTPGAIYTFAYQIDYLEAERQEEQFNPTLVAGNVQVTVAQTPVLPGSVTIAYTVPVNLGGSSYYLTRALADDGAGGVVDEEGAAVPGAVVNYSTGLVSFDPVFTAQGSQFQRANVIKALPKRQADPELGYFKATDTGARYLTGATQQEIEVEFPLGNLVTLRYTPEVTAPADPDRSDALETGLLPIDLTPGTTAPVVPGSVIFTLGGRQYYDRNGTLYYGLDQRTASPGSVGGSINYATGIASLSAWAGGASPAVGITSLLTHLGATPVDLVNGRVAANELRPGTFSLRATRQRDGVLVSGTADNNGNLTGGGLHGYVDVTTGVFSVGFGAYVQDSLLSPEDKAEDWYDPANVAGDGYIWRPDPVVSGTIFYNAVARARLPLDPEIIGINPVRLPPDGRVQAVRAGDTLVIHDTLPTALTGVAAGSTHSLMRTGIASVAVYDAAGLGLPQELYVLDGEAGDLTFADPLDLTGFTAPYTALHTVEDMALCIDAQITGEVSLGAALTHGYTAGNSYCSSALVLGDMRARYEALFAQATWTNVWSDTLIGAAPSSGAQYNDVTWPLEVLNRDAITQRWRIQFTSATAFNVVSEELGILATGTTSVDVAPLNPATGEPYFTLRAAGFGTGWATGNVIRFNTVAAGAPFWLARTTLSGPALGTDDHARLQLRWDKD